VADCKDAATAGAFVEALAGHGGDPAKITEVRIDMGAASINRAAEHPPKAEIAFGKFPPARSSTTQSTRFAASNPLPLFRNIPARRLPDGPREAPPASH
jgi:hypothetical protein